MGFRHSVGLCVCFIANSPKTCWETALVKLSDSYGDKRLGRHIPQHLRKILSKFHIQPSVLVLHLEIYKKKKDEQLYKQIY